MWVSIVLQQLESPLSLFLVIVIQTLPLSRNFISAVSLSCNSNFACLTEIFVIISSVTRNFFVISSVSRNILAISSVSRDEFVIFYVSRNIFVISFVSHNIFVILFSDLPLVLAMAALEPYLEFVWDSTNYKSGRTRQ
jgi:hypothetical protein